VPGSEGDDSPGDIRERSPSKPRATGSYVERKRAEGKSRREALRCRKRLLVRTVFNTLKASPA